ncbi:hypothetical protein MACH10_14010 [Thalassospira tepidiphila]|nr:hypothetical protein MACH10_14010 [Thalassospira tepidiphila]
MFSAAKSMAIRSFVRLFMQGAWCILAFGLVAIFPVGPAAAQSFSERITDFTVNIVIDHSGSISVREDISVYANGTQIKRGIFRDIPLVVALPSGFYQVSQIEISRVFLDGRDVAYRTENIGRDIRIYIGEPDQFLSYGDHEFTLIYKMKDQLSFGEDIDELYWNVTGNRWQFTIDKASATIHLPGDSVRTGFAAYTGYERERGAQFRVPKPDNGNVFTVETTEKLVPGKGLTFAVSWPAGHVVRPEGPINLDQLIRDNIGIVIGFGIWLLLVGYLIWAWSRFGKDPAGPAVIPRFEPPEGMSAAKVGFLWRNASAGRTYASRAFAVVLTSLAVKKRLSISVTGHEEYVLGKLSGKIDDLCDDEQTVFNSLFREAGVSEIIIGDEYRQEVQSAHNWLAKIYAPTNRDTHFIRNDRAWRIGWVIGTLSLLAVVLLDPSIAAHDAESYVGALVGCVIFSVGFMMVFNVLRRFWSGMSAGDGWYVRLIRVLLIGAGFMVPFFGVAVILAGVMSPVAIGVAALPVLTCALFGIWLEVPNTAFLTVRAEIEGYRRYLTMAEEDRLNFASREMGDAIAFFEKHLPFAMALDAEQVWTERFESFLKSRASTDPNAVQSYDPAWYRDSRRGWHGLGDFGSRSAGRLGAVAVSHGAPSIPSTGFASRGGGFSGGGRGGGGGGGW